MFVCFAENVLLFLLRHLREESGNFCLDAETNKRIPVFLKLPKSGDCERESCLDSPMKLPFSSELLAFGYILYECCTVHQTCCMFVMGLSSEQQTQTRVESSRNADDDKYPFPFSYQQEGEDLSEQ